jgi:hypothetical protein
MGAVDVAFTEASVGAGVSTVLFVAAVFLLFTAAKQLVSRLTTTAGRTFWTGAVMTRATSYLIGTLAAFWLIERTYGFFV